MVEREEVSLSTVFATFPQEKVGALERQRRSEMPSRSRAVSGRIQKISCRSFSKIVGGISRSRWKN